MTEVYNLKDPECPIVLMPLGPAPWEPGYTPSRTEDGYGEQWRHSVGGITYRVFIPAPVGIMSHQIRVERLISVAGEAETWEAMWRA